MTRIHYNKGEKGLRRQSHSFLRLHTHFIPFSFLKYPRMATNILVLGGGELGMAMLTALSKRAPPTTKLTVMLRPSTISSPAPSKSTEIASLRTLNIGLLPGDIATS